MKGLYELIELLPKGFIPSFSPRLNKLCLFLIENRNLSQEVANKMYLGDVKRIKYFRELKNELKRSIVNYLIAYPSWQSYKHKEVYEECYRVYAMYKILLINNKRITAIDMAKNLLPKLQKLELHNMAHSVADDLLIHYSVMDVSAKQIKKYTNIINVELNNNIAFSQIRKYYSRVTSICNTRESYNTVIKKEIGQIADMAYSFISEYRHNTNRFIYNILVCKYMVFHDYQGMITCCDEALNSFPNDHPASRSFSFTFLFHKISGLTALGILREAKRVARQASELVPVGNFNWHLVLLKRIIVSLHLGDYQEAYELYKAHTQQKSSFPLIIEYWNIIKGYFYFLIQVKLIEPHSKERFYLGKFLNEMPIYSKDKTGNNINILIIQILVQMTRGQFVKIIDRIDSLREYVRVYTWNEETKRANIFIKMILKMESARFHRKGTETKTKSLLQNLKNTPLRAGQNLAVEVMPYEVLWEEMLAILDNRYRKSVERKISSKAPNRNN